MDHNDSFFGRLWREGGVDLLIATAFLVVMGVDCYLKHLPYLFWMFPASYALMHYFNKQLHLKYDEADQGFIDACKDYINSLEELVQSHREQGKLNDQIIETLCRENLALKEMVSQMSKGD